jgi:hypothetical protein
MKSNETFSVRIDQLQPSQTYLSRARLLNISRHVDFIKKPVPVRLINGRLCLVEGHERCFALSSLGNEMVDVYIDGNRSMSDQVFARLVELAIADGIASIQDFADRLVEPDEFRTLWLEKKKNIQNSGRSAEKVNENN